MSTSATPDPFAAFDAAQDRLEAIMATATQNTARAARAAAATREIRSTVVSPGGEVTVTSRVGGVITDLHFAPHALELDAADLAALVVATIARAQHAAAMDFASDTVIADLL